jgi:hypothetical protein
MNKDVIYNTREVYNILDLVGDVGGLLDGVQYLCNIIIFFAAILGDNQFNQFLINRIFKLVLIQSQLDQSEKGKK